MKLAVSSGTEIRREGARQVEVVWTCKCNARQVKMSKSLRACATIGRYLRSANPTLQIAPLPVFIKTSLQVIITGVR